MTFWVAGAAVGSAVIGGAVQANAASNAADAQEKSARDANNTLMGQFNMTRSDQMPFIQNGTAGNNRLAYLLGINANPALPGGETGPDRQDILNQFEQWRLSFHDANGRPTEVPYTRLDAADRAAFDAEVDRRYREATRNFQTQQAQKLQEAQQAQKSTDAANAANPEFGSLLRKFGQSDLDNDVVYQSGLKSGLDEGRQGIERQAAASGSMLSGATLKALTKYGNDYASTKANDAYNRFNNDKQQTFNMLSGISGTGQVASGQVNAAGQNMANNVSQNQLGVGNARAASAIGSANAWGNAIGQGYNMYQQNQLINKLGYQPNAYGTGGNPYGRYDAAANGGWGIE